MKAVKEILNVFKKMTLVDLLGAPISFAIFSSLFVMIFIHLIVALEYFSYAEVYNIISIACFISLLFAFLKIAFDGMCFLFKSLNIDFNYFATISLIVLCSLVSIDLGVVLFILFLVYRCLKIERKNRDTHRSTKNPIVEVLERSLL